MAQFFGNLASSLSSDGAVKVVKYVCGTLLGLAGIACVCDYDLELGSAGISLKKRSS